MTETTGAEGAAGDGPCPCAPCLARAQARRVRAGRWIVRHSDLTKPPVPLIRWVLLLILGLSCWAAGIPLDFKDWLGPIIIAGALILLDVAGFGIAGVRLDLRQAQDELAALRLRVDMSQVQMGEVHFHGDEAAARVLGRSVSAALGELAAKNELVTFVDDETAKDVAS
jgi:hypothetical protein